MRDTWGLLRGDVAAMVGSDAGPIRALARAALFRRVRAVAYYRIGHALTTRSRALLPVAYWLAGRAQASCGADINPLAEIGPRFNLVHPSGVVIGADVSIGADVWVYQGVTLGSGSRPGQPIIGSRVHIGAGAKVLGGVVVGDDARVGANAVVVDDVPYGCTVVGVPAGPVRRHGTTGRGPETVPRGHGLGA